MKRHQHHLRQKQPPTLLLSEQKGWVNNISQHFFLKLYYTRSHCHALGWLSLNIHVMHTWATLSFAMICHSGAFAKLWKKLWFRGAFATAYRNATHTHTQKLPKPGAEEMQLNLIRQIVSSEAIRLFNPRVSSLAENTGKKGWAPGKKRELCRATVIHHINNIHQHDPQQPVDLIWIVDVKRGSYIIMYVQFHHYSNPKK